MELVPMRTLREIRKKVSQLQIEKIELLVELENLKARAQKNVDCLADEVQQLRDQVNEFTELLNSV
jgi:predicted nuclease with TOPRIM domain